MELSPWANHPKDQPSLLLRSAFPKTDLYEGRRTPSVAVKTNVASDYSRRHPMTYIRCQSHVILGLSDGAASPLPLPLDQNYYSQGAPHITLRAIAFNSHGVNLLTV